MTVYRVFTDTKRYSEKVYSDFTNEQKAKEVLSRKGWSMETIEK